MSIKIISDIKDFFKNKDNNFTKIIIIFLLLIIIYLIIIFQPVSIINVQKIGDILKNDIIASKDITYIDRIGSEKKIKEIKENFPLIFIFDYNITKERLNLINNLIDRLLITHDISTIENIIKENDLQIKKEDIEIIRFIIEKDPYFTEKFSNIYLTISENGVINEIDIPFSNIVVVKNNNDILTETLHNKEEIDRFKVDFYLLKENVDKQFYNLSQKERYFIFSLLKKLIVSNVIFDKEKTEIRLKKEIETNGNVYKEIKKDQVVARKGDIITEENYDKIMAVIESINKELTSNFSIFRFIFVFIFLLSLLIFNYFFIKVYDKNFFNNLYNIIFISIIFFLFIVLVNLPIYLGADKQNIYYGVFIPISAIGITLAFLYSKEISIIFIIIISNLFFIISEYNFISFLFIFFSGISSVYLIKNINKRGQLLKAGLFISIINIFISGLLILNNNLKEINYLYYLVISALNGIFSSILAIGIITLGEIILNSPTVFRLHELSDPSLPLMKELFNSAVGTYNHSILVGNLAEAAANGINTNGLLARVGGYYHDIGKLENPEYFIENQGEYNIHEELKPSISVTIIKSHVKRGIEYAKKYKLPTKVIDIISQHHGNSLIEFFYKKALNTSDQTKEDVKEDFYKYNGDKPQFQEAAIVMLADQVEAATRSLKKHTLNNITQIIEEIISKNYIDGQLDDSGLTLKDLTKIKDIFIKLLVGMYHSRIAYRNKDEINNQEKEKLIN